MISPLVRPTSPRRCCLAATATLRFSGRWARPARAPSFVPRRLAVSLLGYAGTVQIEAVPTGGQQSWV